MDMKKKWSPLSQKNNIFYFHSYFAKLSFVSNTLRWRNHMKTFIFSGISNLQRYFWSNLVWLFVKSSYIDCSLVSKQTYPAPIFLTKSSWLLHIIDIEARIHLAALGEPQATIRSSTTHIRVPASDRHPTVRRALGRRVQSTSWLYICSRARGYVEQQIQIW
jgi:hypothetical protein